jgi:subtilisin family serine protease
MLLALPAWAQDKTESVNGEDVAANEVLVKFRTPGLQTVAQAEQVADVDRAEEVGGVGVLRFHSRTKNVTTLLSELAARPDVEYVEPNYILHAIANTAAIPNDPRFGELWGLQNTGQAILGVPGTPGADIRAVPAWDISTGSKSFVATVVDTGLDYNHPDLADNVWSAPADFTVNIGGVPIVCLAGSHGFNAITRVCDPLDDNNHGTHVSGTIGAVGNNAMGVVGVNWTTSIMGAKFLNAGGSGLISDAVNAIEFSIQAKAAFGGPTGAANVRVLSNSWGGGGYSQTLFDEINKANSNDILFVAAAGNNPPLDNDVSPTYPASYNTPNMVAVAATDNKDDLASFSHYGATSVHLGAPGVNVLSTVRFGGYAYFNGTSMATPHVSGAALLILSACPLDTAGLKTVILNNVDPIPSLDGKTTTGGRLNVNSAIRACSGGTPAFSLTATPSSVTVIPGGSVDYSVEIVPSGGFANDATFSVDGLPASASGSFSPNPSPDFSTLTVTTDFTTPPGTYPLTITGTSGTLTRTTSVTLAVTP